jgi:hypothetical protein
MTARKGKASFDFTVKGEKSSPQTGSIPNKEPIGARKTIRKQTTLLQFLKDFPERYIRVEKQNMT